jgi:GntR family transcriptional regulator
MHDKKLLALAPDAGSHQPAEIQFFQKLKNAISAGYWQPDEIVPTPAQFAELFAIPLAAAQAVFDQLSRESWIKLNTEQQYQITPKIDQPISRLTSFSDLVSARGFKPGSIWLSREVAEPNMDEQWRLKLKSAAKVSRLTRLRSANEMVIGFESTTIPSSILPDPNLVGSSLYQFLNANNLVIAKAVEEIDAYACDAHMAQLCGFQVGQALLRLTRVSFLPNGRAFELSYSYFRSDYYRYVVEFND